MPPLAILAYFIYTLQVKDAAKQKSLGTKYRMSCFVCAKNNFLTKWYDFIFKLFIMLTMLHFSHIPDHAGRTPMYANDN